MLLIRGAERYVAVAGDESLRAISSEDFVRILRRIWPQRNGKPSVADLEAVDILQNFRIVFDAVEGLVIAGLRFDLHPDHIPCRLPHGGCRHRSEDHQNHQNKTRHFN